LTSFDVHRLPNLFTDVLVIGSGVAGLRAAIEAAKYAKVLLVTKGRIDTSNTARAQGGIAVVMDTTDSLEKHVEDTLKVGCGLCDLAAVKRVVSEGPDRVRELVDWGALFDRRGKRLLLGLEAGPSSPRIIHAMGDETGREVSDTLIRVARATPNLRIFEDCYTLDLLVTEGLCCGITTYHRHFGHQIFWARKTILASGGSGQIYRETTNSEMATGDGLAIAYRAGAPLRDMEMMQFHPTTLYIAGASRMLISEAVRGEGAYLVDSKGRRFMQDYHPDAELAPRDVVSRAIIKEIAKQTATCMYLDVRHLNVEKFRKRFPMISRMCEEFDINIEKQGIPVRPAAHYLIGGIKVDEETRTAMPGLFACGEVASSGIHGANRLASNSLLEGLVFGAVAGRIAGEETTLNQSPMKPDLKSYQVKPSTRTFLDLADIKNSLRSLMWRNVGIERNGPHLQETAEIINFWGQYVMDKLFENPAGWEIQNMLTVARLMTAAAYHRRESRGVHFRADYPETSEDHQHMIIQHRGEELSVTWES